MQKTATILKGLVTDVSRHNPLGISLIASNSVDVSTYAAWKWSGLRASQVIGSGTSLDTARFRRRLAERYVRRDEKYYLMEVWSVLGKRVVTAEFEHRGEKNNDQREVRLVYPQMDVSSRAIGIYC
jgi:lactate/malate dehydrogenase family protein